MEEYFTDKVRSNFDVMYAGDISRDASSTIRGFLFQDLVAIDFLLEEDTKYVFVEFLEDVDVAGNDGDFKIIQVKYYPRTHPNINEIIEDLYYQYLRFSLLNRREGDSAINIKTQLLIHCVPDLPSIDDITFTGCIERIVQERVYEERDVEEYLTQDILVFKKKEEQKKQVFARWADNDSFLDFKRNLQLIKKDNIVDFQESLERKLEQIFSEGASALLPIVRGKILVGLALTFIQERYKHEKSGFDDIKISKNEFYEYIRHNLNMIDDKHIVAYISAIAIEEYETIILENSDLSDEQINCLNIICKNTVEWISEYFDSQDGQFKLINTLSTDRKAKVLEFKTADNLDRLIYIAGCKENMKDFFKYLWKIMLNICFEGGNSNFAENEDLLRPQTYIQNPDAKYICIHFPQDWAETSVIVPSSGGSFESKKDHLRCRLIDEKPKKWFMKCDREFAGQHDYTYTTSCIAKNESITDSIDKDNFTIECMECIRIDKNKWAQIEDCKSCIFARECVKGNN